MSTKNSSFNLIVRLWRHFNRRRQKQFVLLFILMIIAALADMISIGAVLPFLGVLTTPDTVFAHPAIQPVIVFLGIKNSSELILPLTLSFIFFISVSGTVRFTLLFISTRLSFAAGHDVSFNIFRRTLYQPYIVHTDRNSSELINGINIKADIVIYNVLMPVLTLLSTIIMLSAIVTILIFANTLLAMATFVVFGGIYGVIIKTTRRRLKRNSKCVAEESNKVIKSLQEGLGGIRDVLIDGSQEIFCQVYRNADLPLRRAQSDIHIISGSPRFLIETLGMVVIAIAAYIMAQGSDGITSAIPVLGILAISAQRLLPVLQQGFGAVSNIKGAEDSLIDILVLLEQEVMPDQNQDSSASASLLFRQNIRLKNLSFCYKSEDSWVLKDVNFTVKKGDRIGFIGKTGSGKSTLLDVVMGLLPPTEGALLIDGQPITETNLRAWQEHIAHVPQNIYLTDGTLSENIAFGIPKDQIDHVRVNQAANRAQIADEIESWPQKYNTVCGERGIRLSGGQRQRIGIARALYKKASLIIFDEATSALDNRTEQAVMNSLDNLEDGLTILIIAHRLTTLENCDAVIEVGSEGVFKVTRKDRIRCN